MIRRPRQQVSEVRGEEMNNHAVPTLSIRATHSKTVVRRRSRPTGLAKAARMARQYQYFETMFRVFGIDMHQRVVQVAVGPTIIIDGVNHTALTLPSSTLAVPPGPYRLFLLDGNRIPSAGIPVQVNP